MSQAVTEASNQVRDMDFLGMNLRSHDGAAGQLNEFSAPAGPIAPPHRHTWPEAHYIVEGEVEFMVAGALHRVGAGGFFTIPGNTVHASTAVSPTVRWVEFTSPGGPVEFFAQIAREAPGLPPDMDQLTAIAAAHDVEVVLG